MHENTPPHTPVFHLEEEIEEAEDGEVIYFDDDHIPDDAGYDEYLEGEDREDYEFDDDDKDVPHKIPERDDAALTFSKHDAAVFCCSLHPTLNLAATGGEDDRAFVWNFNTGEVLQTILHGDSVIASTFSNDGHYLATGDMAGKIKAFKVTEDEIKQIWDFDMGDMCWLKWHTSAHVLLAGSDSGEIYVWRIPSGDCKVLPGHKGVKCEIAELTNDGKKLFAGYGDGTVKLWDIKSSSAVLHIPPGENGHSECVSSVSCDPEKPLYMSGGEDGRILVLSDSGLIETIDPSGGPVEAVAFCLEPEYRLAASGTLHGQIAIWDTNKHSIRATCEHPEADDGITILKWLPGQTVICGTIQGNIYAFDGRSGIRKFDLQGHANEVYDIYYRKDKKILITASEDSSAKIFKVNL